MADTYSNMLVHVIYSTKNREPYITPDLQPRLYSYIGGIARESSAILLEAGGTADHIHLLIKYPPRIAVADLVRVIKTNSSRWVRGEFNKAFAWQGGYASFSVSESAALDVRSYLQGQAEHHKSITFQDEVRAFLRRNGIDFDERYLWD